MNGITTIECEAFIEWLKTCPVPGNLERVSKHIIQTIANECHHRNGLFRDDTPNHACTTLLYKGKNVKIDDALVPLMRALWNRGIETLFCCQGDPMHLQGDGNIVFADARSAQMFIDEIQRDGALTISHEHWSISNDFLTRNNLTTLEAINAYRRRLLVVTLAYGNLEGGRCSLDVRFHTEQIEHLTRLFSASERPGQDIEETVA